MHGWVTNENPYRRRRAGETITADIFFSHFYAVRNNFSTVASTYRFLRAQKQKKNGVGLTDSTGTNTRGTVSSEQNRTVYCLIWTVVAQRNAHTFAQTQLHRTVQYMYVLEYIL